MAVILGEGNFRYEALAEWEKLPDGMKLLEDARRGGGTPRTKSTPFTRNPDSPVIVFDRDGNVVRTFGQGIFGRRSHGILIGPDDSVWCAGRRHPHHHQVLP